MLACLGHRFSEGARGKPIVLFSDAAVEGYHFKVGVVGSEGLYKSTRCPSWVASLQQAELWGIMFASKIGTYIVRNVRGGRGGKVFSSASGPTARWAGTRPSGGKRVSNYPHSREFSGISSGFASG